MSGAADPGRGEAPVAGGATTAVAVVTLCSAPRLAHLRNQLRALAGGGATRIVVWIGDEPVPESELDAEAVVSVPPGADGLRLAAARNAGAARARELGADLVVFLDADCVPGDELLARYRQAHSQRPDAVLCGPVTYLPPGAALDGPSLVAATAPHPARPAPAPGELRDAEPGEYPLFWSLSFALGVDVWHLAGGFDPAYEGYGGEDTDFAFALRQARIPLVWVGGAHAYHQHHPTSSPPWQHLDDILRNGALFAAKWGEWPMRGWLGAFAAAGAVVEVDGRWQRASP